MPFKRAMRRPVGPAKKRRSMNISAPRKARFTKTPVWKVNRTCYLGTITPATTSINGYWQYRSVALSNGFVNAVGVGMGGLSNLAEYTPMFDQYKLGAYKIELRPKFNNLSTDQNPSGTPGTVIDQHYVSLIMDSVSNVVPSGTYSAATFNSFLENGHVKTFRGDRKVTIYNGKPMVNEQYGAGATRFIRAKWTNLDASGQSMPHLGFHLFFHNQSFATLTQTYDVFVTYYVQFKGMR